MRRANPIERARPGRPGDRNRGRANPIPRSTPNVRKATSEPNSPPRVRRRLDRMDPIYHLPPSGLIYPHRRLLHPGGSRNPPHFWSSEPNRRRGSFGRNRAERTQSRGRGRRSRDRRNRAERTQFPRINGGSEGRTKAARANPISEARRRRGSSDAPGRMPPPSSVADELIPPVPSINAIEIRRPISESGATPGDFGPGERKMKGSDRAGADGGPTPGRIGFGGPNAAVTSHREGAQGHGIS